MFDSSGEGLSVQLMIVAFIRADYPPLFGGIGA